MSDIKDAYRQQDAGRESADSGGGGPRRQWLVVGVAGLLVVGGLLMLGTTGWTNGGQSPATPNTTTQSEPATGQTAGVVSVSFDQSATTTNTTVEVFLYRVTHVDHVTVRVDGTDHRQRVTSTGMVTFEGLSAGQTVVVTKTVNGQTATVATHTVE